MIDIEAEKLLERAIEQNIADIHFMPAPKVYKIYFRFPNELVLVKTLSLVEGERLITYFKFMANMDVGEKRKPQSGSCSFQLKMAKLELRTSTICHFSLAETLVIRLLKVKKENHVIQHFFPSQIEAIRKLCLKKQGLLVFSGPVDSGKTTLMHQLLKQVYALKPLNIMTIEDPVEIVNQDFLQTEINELAGVDYDTLIKASLRHHPDIILVGEIRDEKTARMAVRAALTGHLVMTTIHAQSCHGVIERLKDLSVSSALLKETLIGVVTQRLLPRYCYLCQGACQRFCQHLEKSQKRFVLTHLLKGKALNDYWQRPRPHSLNQALTKAYQCQYIDQATREAYWIEG